MAEISRRTLLSRTVVLGGLAVGVGLGFTGGVRHRVAEPPPPAPAALTNALGRQQRLLAGYRAVGSDPARPALAGLRADVTAHGDALRALLERYPGWRLAEAPGSAAASGSASASGSPSVSGSASASGSDSASASGSPSAAASTSPAATSVTGLAAASTADAQALSDAALGWPAAEQHAGEVVPVLASIAACLTSHAQVLA